MPTIVRYYLFQLPGWIFAALILGWLWSSLGLPEWIAWLLLSLYILKDVVLYPLLRSAYDREVPSGTKELVGSQGFARDRLDPGGYVSIRGELWRAEISPGTPPIQAGSPIRVVNGERMTLIVEELAP